MNCFFVFFSAIKEEKEEILFFGFAGLVAGVVADVLVVDVDFLQLVQLRDTSLHFALDDFEEVEILFNAILTVNFFYSSMNTIWGYNIKHLSGLV